MPTQLREKDFALAEHAQEHRIVVAPVGATPADLEKPEFWAAVARHLKPWSRFTIRAQDGSFYLETVVIAVEAGLPVLRKLAGFIDEDAEAEPDLKDGIRVEFAGEREGWRVVRVADGYVIKAGLREKREARRQRTLYLGESARRAAA